MLSAQQIKVVPHVQLASIGIQEVVSDVQAPVLSVALVENVQHVLTASDSIVITDVFP